MNRMYVLCFALLALAATACAQSGFLPLSGSGASPSGARSAASSIPIENGAKYTYLRRWKTDVVLYGGHGTPSPAPVASAIDTVLVAAKQHFNGHSGLSSFTHQWTTAQTLTVNRADYVALIPQGAFTAVSLSGSVDNETLATDPSYRTTITSVNVPPFAQAEMPFKRGNSWTAISTNTYADSTESSIFNYSISSLSKASGAYTYRFAEHSAHPKSFLAVESWVHADGAARQTDSYDKCSQNVETFGPPQQSGSQWVIPIVFTPGVCPTTQGTPQPEQTTIPDWYPQKGKLTSLQSERLFDRGTMPFPKHCDVPKSLATQGEKIEDHLVETDPTNGLFNTVITSYYAAGIGLACYILDERITVVDVFPDAHAGTVVGTYRRTISESLQSADLPSLLRRAGFLHAGDAAMGVIAPRDDRALGDMRAIVVQARLKRVNPR
jgi:hypothetical protein